MENLYMKYYNIFFISVILGSLVALLLMMATMIIIAIDTSCKDNELDEKDLDEKDLNEKDLNEKDLRETIVRSAKISVFFGAVGTVIFFLILS